MRGSWLRQKSCRGVGLAGCLILYISQEDPGPLDRLHDLVLAPSDSKGSTLDPDTVAREHHSFFFPDNGRGAALLPASASATAAKVLVCVFAFVI